MTITILATNDRQHLQSRWYVKSHLNIYLTECSDFESHFLNFVRLRHKERI